MPDRKSGPAFIGIGAQRAGSTWLSVALNRHPDIFVTPKKEIHYFDASSEYPTPCMCSAQGRLRRLFGRDEASRNWRFWLRRTQSNGISIFRNPWWRRYYFGKYDDVWYRSLFDPGARKRLAGEITPGYSLLDPSRIEWMRRVAPEAKIILVLRNPIDRAWSQYQFARKWHAQCREREHNPHSLEYLNGSEVLPRGDYEAIIRRWRPVWRESFGIFCFEDMAEDPEGFLSRILQFLEVPNRNARTIQHMIPAGVPNRQGNTSMPPETREALCRHYQPMLDKMRREFGPWVARWENMNREPIENQRTPL